MTRDEPGWPGEFLTVHYSDINKIIYVITTWIRKKQSQPLSPTMITRQELIVTNFFLYLLSWINKHSSNSTLPINTTI
jgi:hypothetical protein